MITAETRRAIKDLLISSILNNKITGQFEDEVEQAAAVYAGIHDIDIDYLKGRLETFNSEAWGDYNSQLSASDKLFNIMLDNHERILEANL